mmetsp:Transcript_44886/g.142482  ORF Transcript_44886/g.142482 Transcript_44886/m.142482 type:complete len:101 (+) Transcript_44886:53-355(+)
MRHGFYHHVQDRSWLASAVEAWESHGHVIARPSADCDMPPAPAPDPAALDPDAEKQRMPMDLSAPLPQQCFKRHAPADPVQIEGKRPRPLLPIQQQHMRH